MEFNLDSYQPIDYREWILGDECRKAVNLKRLNMLNDREISLIEISSKYQDCRNDPGHGEFATYSALRLLPYYPNAKREVVVPTVWVHDMGFYGEDPSSWQKLVAEARAKGNLKGLDDEVRRRPHQNRGCFLSRELFQIAGYPPKEYYLESEYIIGDHDIRKHPTTVNGKIMRTADLLWRTSYPQAQIYMANLEPEEILQMIEKTCLKGERTHLGEIGIQIARLDFANTMFYKFGEKAFPLLEQEYSKELKKIIRLYS